HDGPAIGHLTTFLVALAAHRPRVGLFPALLEQLRHAPRPAGLVAGPDPGAVVTVEVFVEEDQVAPVRIALEALGPAIHGAAPVLVTEEDAGEAPRNLRGHRPQIEHRARAGRKRDLERVAVAVVELLARLDQQIVHGTP